MPENDRPIQVLVAEDSEDDFILLESTLRRQGIAAQCERIETAQAMREALARQSWDLVISDHQMPSFSSFDALATLRESDAFVPFMIVSGTIGEDLAVAAMQAGADDYLVKGRLARLGAAIRRALASSQTRRERDLAERELAESRQQLQALSAHLQSSIEDERRSIAREIHDDVGSALTGLKFDLDWLVRQSDARIAERARQAQAVLAQAQEACQRIMRDLRPPVLEAGLLPALQWLTSQFRQRYPIGLELHSNRDPLTVSDDVALTVFRTAQEALNNIGKHSGARQARIDVVQRADGLSVEIVDDGRGLTSDDRRKPGSFGLRGLAERALAVGGWLEVEGNSRGTVLLLTIGADKVAA